MDTGHIYIFIFKPHGHGTYLYIYFKTSWTRDIFSFSFFKEYLSIFESEYPYCSSKLQNLQHIIIIVAAAIFELLFLL